MSLSSANRMVWQYFETLRRLVRETRNAKDESHIRQSAALTVIMSVTVVEVFFNLWFRVRAEEGNPADRDALVKDLSYPRPISLDKKLKTWPSRYLRKDLDLSSGPGADFLKLKELRNSIVHFSSSYSTLSLPGLQIHGMADTTAYDELSFEKALEALKVAEALVKEIFTLAGLSAEQVPHALHAWSGLPPTIPSGRAQSNTDSTPLSSV